MSGYTLSPESEDDLFEIWLYLVENADIQLAERVETALFEHFALLAGNPGLGHKRQDLTVAPVLFYRVLPYQYLIVYRRANLGIEIVAVLHGKRDVARVLTERGSS
jgi:plasmid stabilization system protein ParE